MVELSDGVKKDLSFFDECACQIKDNLIMFTGSSFNLTDYIMACASNLDVCIWNSYDPIECFLTTNFLDIQYLQGFWFGHIKH